MSRKKPQILVIFSSLLVVAGVFLPLASIPVYGDITCNRIASDESYLVNLMGICIPVLLILEKTRTLIMPVPAIQTQLQKQGDARMFDKLMTVATDPLKNFARDMFLNITEFNWGWLCVSGRPADVTHFK